MQSDIQLDDAAVWDEHLEISVNATHEFVAATRSNALATLNGTALAQPTAIRNGDVLGIGGANIQFWLADPGQRGLAFREWLTWIGIAIICMAQVALIYWLLST